MFAKIRFGEIRDNCDGKLISQKTQGRFHKCQDRRRSESTWERAKSERYYERDMLPVTVNAPEVSR